jgi:hypothetical protein
MIFVKTARRLTGASIKSAKNEKTKVSLLGRKLDQASN